MSNRKKIRPFRRKLAPSTTPAQIAAMLQGKAGAVVLEHRHEPHCPTIRTQREADCICEPDRYLVAPFGLKAVQR